MKHLFLDIKTNYGKNYFGKYPDVVNVIETWITYGRLASMTYMLLPSLIKNIKSGKYKEEYESILKELNPKGFEKYKKTGEVKPYFNLKEMQ